MGVESMDATCPECGSELPQHAPECPVCEASLLQPGASEPGISDEGARVTSGEAWLTVCVGSMSEIVALRAVLEDAGISTFVPDSMTKVIDPFITGGNVFEVRLQQPFAKPGNR